MNEKKINNYIEEDDKKSNSSVLNLSLDSNKEISKDSISSDNISSLKKDLMNEVNLPIENEINTTEFIYKEMGKKIESNNNDIFFGNNQPKLKNLKNNLKERKRSNSFDEEKKIKKKYNHIKKDPSDYISPLKLCRKTFGTIPEWNKRPNQVLCDFQKNVLDNNSCNDDESQDDLFLTFSETERTTPNPNDLNKLLDCRKKMALFKNSINNRTIKEYENILNSENIFTNKNNSKKNNFWNKHIKHILRDRNNNIFPNSSFSRMSAGAIVDNEAKNKEDGLFILGILESAVNERKGRYTTNT